MCIRVECEIFFWEAHAYPFYQWSGMILDAQNENFGTRQSFDLQKIIETLKLNIFFFNLYTHS